MPNTGTKLDGTVTTVDGRAVIRFERRLPHPRPKVWDAITQPAQIGRWFGISEIDLELVEGGRFDIRTVGPPELVEAVRREAGEDALVQHHHVLTVEPPALFVHTFGEPDATVRWELREDGDATILTLLHTEPSGIDSSANAPRDLAGWHVVLDLLAALLDGRPGVWSAGAWDAVRAGYAGEITG
jgi:uncharacterized protein YndB with AHSA1/START domain